MADKKISELDAITGSATAATDVFVVVDTSTGQTKKITREELNNAIEQDVLSTVDINGGTIDGTVIGGTTPAAGTFTSGTFTGDVSFGDNDKAIFGAGSDLQIFHNSANGNSIIKEQGGGILTFQTNGSEISFYDTANLATMATFSTGGSVVLRHNGSNKFSTISTGIDVTGTVTADGLTVEGTNGNFEVATTGNSVNMTRAGNNFITASNASGDLYLGAGGTSFLKIDNGGDISFYEDTGTTAKLFWDASAEALGIGTSSPEGTLHIENISNNSLIMDAPANRFNSIGFQTAGVDKWWLGRADSDQISGDAFFIGIDNGNVTDAGGLSNKLVITQSGAVGIGTSSPATELDIAATNNPTITLSTTNVTLSDQEALGGLVFQNSDTSGTPPHKFGIIAKADDTFGDGSLWFYTTRDGIETSATPAVYIGGKGSDANNVGIGTSSPSAPLHIVNSSAPRLEMGYGGGSNGDHRIAWDSAGLVISADQNNQSSGASYLAMLVDGSERMRIDSSGKVLVGKTSSSISTVGVELGVGYSYFTSSGINQYVNRTSDGETIRFFRSGAQVGSITVSTVATAYNTSSDYRLKENVTGITDGIERVKQLNPSRFNFIADADTTVDGFIAHEAATVVPEAVTGEKDAVDADGNPEYQGIDQSKLVPLLTAALQEAITKIEDLEARVATLEGN